MNKANFTIKPISTDHDDQLEIARLHLEVRQGQVKDYGNVFSNIYESQIDLKAIGAFYIEPGGNFFVARDKYTKQIAGFIGVKNEGSGIGRIRRMAVIEQFRHKGIGLALAQTAVKWAKNRGYFKLVLSTGIKEHAKPIYDSVGFVVTGIKQGKDRKDKDYLMELRL